MEYLSIKIGDKVMYCGAFGRSAPKEATIVGIELCAPGKKYGDVVEAIPLKLKNHGVFDLNNGHWCYGDQIEELVINEQYYRITNI